MSLFKNESLPRPGPTSQLVEELSNSGDEEEEIILLDKQSDNIFHGERNLIPAAKLDESSSNSVASSLEYQGVFDDHLSNGSNLMRGTSSRNWTNKEINTAIQEIKDEQRALKSEEEITNVKMELKKIKSASGHVISLTHKVSNMENEIAKAEKDKQDRANEIAELRREVTELKMLQAKYHSLACRARSDGKVQKVISSIRSIFVPGSKDGSFRKFVPRAQTETHLDRYSIERPSWNTIASYPELDDELNYSSTSTRLSESSKEREVASLQRKIAFLEMKNKCGESEVEILQQHLSQLSSTVEMLQTGMGQKTKNPIDKAYIEELKKNVPKGRPLDAIRSSVRSQINQDVMWEEKYQQKHESLVPRSSSGSRVPSTSPGSIAACNSLDTSFPVRKCHSKGNQKLLDYDSFRKLDPSIVKTKSISFVL